MFIFASSVCKFLQCLISALTQGGEGDNLFRLTFSLVLWGGRDTANKYHWPCVGSAHSVWATLDLPQLKAMCASGVCTAQAPGCSAAALSRVGPAFRALPTSQPLRFSGTLQGHDSVGCPLFAIPMSEQLRRPGVCQATAPGGPRILVTSPIATNALSQVCRVSPRELISGCGPPGRCQPCRIPGRRV